MHSFQPSRGRIFFEVFSALAIAASLAGAWAQTGASALLAAAVVAGLSGMVHAFDLARSRPTAAEEPQRIEIEPEAHDVIVPMVAVEELRAVAQEAEGEAAELVEAAPSRAASGRRSGGSRKGSGRRAKPRKEPTVAELVPVDEAVVPWPTAEEAYPPTDSPPAEEEFAFLPEEDAGQPHIAPLFEPDPFVRMPRRAFGRKAG